MNLFTIEKDKCGKDGKCARVCPANVIEHAGKGSFPIYTESSAKKCINCGHCMAVCSSGALKLNSMDPKECIDIKLEMIPSPEEVKLFFSSRRSTRNYQDTPVEKELLKKLFEIAAYAPSGHNAQPVNWLVISDKKEIHKLSGMTIDWMRSLLKIKPSGLQRIVDDWDNGIDRICRGAPQLIIAHAPKSSHPPLVDCTIALTYLELAAHSMKLGTCWAGFLSSAATHYPPMAEALKLPEGHQCYGAMMIGYPKYRYQRIPLRKKPVITWR